MNGEAVFLYHEPNAHTDGGSIVLFRASDVVVTGDLFTPGAYPFLDVDHGGSVQGEIAGLNHILDLTVPPRLRRQGPMSFRVTVAFATKPTWSNSWTWW